MLDSVLDSVSRCGCNRQIGYTASQVGEYGWIGGASTEFWISPPDELVVITLAQHIPFSELSERVKPLVYDAILGRNA